MVKDFQEQTRIRVNFVFSSIPGKFTHLSPNCHFLCKTEMTSPSHLLLLLVGFFFFLFLFSYSEALDTSLKRNSRFPPHFGIQQGLQAERVSFESRCQPVPCIIKIQFQLLNLPGARWPNYVFPAVRSPGAELGCACHTLQALSRLSN